MYITKISLENYRCYNSISIPLTEPITVLVGENDIGKTTLLDAIETVFNAKPLQPNDIRKTNDNQASRTCSICITLKTDIQDNVPDDYLLEPDNDSIMIKREFDGQTTRHLINKRVPCDPDIENFSKVSADRQKEIIKQVLSEDPGRNVTQRLEQIERAKAQDLIPMKFSFVSVRWSDISDFLPNIERISALEYQAPNSLVTRTFKSVASKVIAPTISNDGQPVLVSQLKEIESKIKDALSDEIKKAKILLKRKHTRFKDIEIEPIIDFSNSVKSFSLRVDVGEGLREVQDLGAGTQRRIWMGLLEWENDTRRSEKPLIRLYDEPDSNLHFEAQRALFDEINRAAKDQDFLKQTIICTHSLAILDRAPLPSIRLLQLDDQSDKRIYFKFSGSPADAAGFYHDLGSAVGLTNSALLYEKAFLIVEGESEEEALQYFYHHQYNTSLREDCIVMINLHTCGAWKSALEVLLKNRSQLTYFLLDQDCLEPNSSAKLTPQRLLEAGCQQDFLNKHVTFIGKKEFEDIFSLSLICHAANEYYPRDDERTWQEDDFIPVSESEKFSKTLQQIIRTSTKRELRSETGKPEIATALAKSACKQNKVPAPIHQALKRVREIAGIPSPKTCNSSAEFEQNKSLPAPLIQEIEFGE